MGKFQATEGLVSLGVAEFSSSLATTTTGTSTFNNDATFKDTTTFSGSIKFGGASLPYISQASFLDASGANAYVVSAGINARFLYPWATYSGGRNRILGTGTNFVGDLITNPWSVINGGLFQFEVTGGQNDLIITAVNLSSMDLSFVSFSFITTNSNIRDLKINTPVYTGTSWQYRLEGSRSATNYSYTTGGTIASNTTFTLPFAPQSTSITHVIVDNVERRFIIHCTNLT